MLKELLWLFPLKFKFTFSPFHFPHDACQTIINSPYLNIWRFFKQPKANNKKCNYENIRAATLSFSPVTFRAPHAFMFAGFSISLPNYMSQQNLRGHIFQRPISAASGRQRTQNCFHRNFVLWGSKANICLISRNCMSSFQRE